MDVQEEKMYMQGWRRWGQLTVIVLLLALGTLGIFSLVLNSPQSAAAAVQLPLQFAQRPLQASDLILNKKGPEAVYAGDILTYVVAVTNTSANVLDNVVLTDTWTTDMSQDLWKRGVLAHFNGNYAVTPPGAVTNFSYLINTEARRGEAYWALAPLNPGQRVQIVFTMTSPITLQPALKEHLPYKAVGPSILGNSITAGAPGQDKVTAQATTLILGPLLRTNLDVAAEATIGNNCRVGRLITYTFSILNVNVDGSVLRPDSAPARNLYGEFLLPLPLRQSKFINSVTSAANVSSTYYSKTGYLKWQYPGDYVLMPGARTYITVAMRVPPEAAYNPSKKYVATIQNDMQLWADSMLNSARMDDTSNFRILSPFDKSVATQVPPASTFAGRVITYTLTFYNPLQVPLTSMVMTDTLFEEFQYAATVVGPLPDVVAGPMLPWNDLAVPANGSISTTFRVLVPPTVAPNKCGVSHYNHVTATHALFPVSYYIGHDENELAPVLVVESLVMTKKAAPTKQFPGEMVVYDIKLENKSDQTVFGIVLTDTLPVEFVYAGMVSSSPGEPVVITSTNQLRWESIPPIEGKATLQFSFKAIAYGMAYTKHYNALSAVSNIVVCPLLKDGGVTIDLPLKLNKIASTSVITQGDRFFYEATLFNLHPNEIYSVSAFMDTLPAGMVDVTDGDHQYLKTLPNPVPIPPLTGEWETGPFEVLVLGEGTGSAWCEKMKNSMSQKLAQLTGQVEVYVEPFDLWFYNANSLASVTVIPHVSLSQAASPNPAPYNGIQVITFTLKDNRTNPITPVTGIDLEWVIPLSDMELYTVLDTNPPSASQMEGLVKWENLTIPVGGILNVVVTTRTPEPQNVNKARNYDSLVRVTQVDDDYICIPSDEFSLSVKRGLEVSKTPKPNTVGPFGAVEYTIEIENQLGMAVSNVVITDLLPSDWVYVANTGLIEPISTEPPAWRFNIGPLETVKLKFQARAYNYLGYWHNFLAGAGPVDIFYSANYTSSVKVFVSPGVGFYKTVEPTAIVGGQSAVYSIVLYNGTETALRDIVITDTLPYGLAYTEMVLGSTPVITGNQLIWRIPTVLDTNKTLRLQFRVNTTSETPTGIYYNQAIATANSVATGEPMNIPTIENAAPLKIKGIPAVQIRKEAEPTAVYAGDLITYTVTLYNETDETHALIVTDTLPYSVTFVAAISPPNVQIIPGQHQKVVWAGLTINPYQELQLSFQARVAPLAEGEYCNAVQAAMSGFVLPLVPNMACVDVSPVPWPELQVTKRPSIDPVLPGGALSYEIEVVNTGNISLTFVVTDTLPPQVIPTGVMTWAASLAPGEIWTTLAEVAASSSYIGVLTNVVEARAAEGAYAVYTATSTARTDPHIDISKMVDTPIAAPGANIIYTLYATNTGNTPLQVVITDTLPAHLLEQSGVLTWTFSLAPGEVWVQTVPVRLALDYSGKLTNTLAAWTQAGVTDSAVLVSEVRDNPNLAVYKVANVSACYPGDVITYTLYVTNTGNIALEPQVVDILPPGLTPTGAFEWFPTLTPGQVWQHVLTATVNLNTSPGIVKNQLLAIAAGLNISTTRSVTILPSSQPVSTTIYLPLVLRAYANVAGPDLVVTAIRVPAGQSNPRTVYVDVKNQGNQPVAPGNNFYVDLYVNREPATNLVGDLTWGVQGGWLPAGATYTFNGALNLSTGAQLYAQIDTDNTVIEANESNNTIGPIGYDGVLNLTGLEMGPTLPAELAQPRPTPTLLP